MRSKFLLLIVLISMFALTACSSESDALKFKKDYESLNGVVNSSGKEHRYLSIPQDNPFVIASAEDIVSKIEAGETFYVYFGSKLCPWCRSVLSKAIDVSKKNIIDSIYYVDIWDDEGNEILRDKYVVDDKDNINKVNDGTDAYFKLLEHFDNLLPDYTYTSNKDGKSKSFNEKRIFAPTFIYVSNGKAVRMTTGLSDKQKGSRDELTDEILNDEEKLFSKFFVNSCDSSC